MTGGGRVGLWGAVALAAAVSAQQPQQPAAFRSGVQVVEVDVRVFDREGRFVTTLTRDDVEILEDGVPQQVLAISLVGAPTAASGTGQAAAPEAAGQTGHQPPATSNRHTWVFFFDLNHLTPGGGFERARTAAADFIRDRFTDGDLAGVVAGASLVNNRLTTVRDELVAAVNGVKPRTDSRNRQMELTREWPRLLNEDEAAEIVRNNKGAIDRAVMRAVQDDPSEPDAEGRVRSKAQRLMLDIRRATLETLTAVNALASGLARMPGPKTIVFLSDGFSINGIETTLRSVVGQAARAGARVYAIDVRGLNRGRGAGIIDQELVDNDIGAPPAFDAQADGVNSLAIDTGGMMIRNENNIGRALDAIAADANRYYVIGYQPANGTFDGTYRRIDVRVKRDGVRVRARRGYLALEPARMLTPRPIRAPEPAPIGAGTVPGPPERGIAAPPQPAAAVPSARPPAEPAGTQAPEGALRLRPTVGDRIRALSGGAAAGGADPAARGWAAYERGDIEAARPLFEAAAADAAVRPWVLYVLGLTYSGLDRISEAAALWERVRDAAPAFAEVYLDLASAYMRMGDASRALAVLRDAERRWPDSQDVLNAVGVIHVRRDALDDAIAVFTKAAAAAPDDPLAHLNLGRAYELRYERGRRFVTSQGRWVAPEGDRQKAAASYERCVRLGGPYAARASAALSRLEWSK